MWADIVVESLVLGGILLFVTGFIASVLWEVAKTLGFVPDMRAFVIAILLLVFAGAGPLVATVASGQSCSQCREVPPMGEQSGLFKEYGWPLGWRTDRPAENIRSWPGYWEMSVYRENGFSPLFFAIDVGVYYFLIGTLELLIVVPWFALLLRRRLRHEGPGVSPRPSRVPPPDPRSFTRELDSQRLRW